MSSNNSDGLRAFETECPHCGGRFIVSSELMVEQLAKLIKEKDIMESELTALKRALRKYDDEL